MARLVAIFDSRASRATLLLFSTVVLVVALVVFLRSRSEAAPGLPETERSVRPAQSLEDRYGPEITPPQVALETARTFIRTAVLRTDLDTAWQVTAPELKKGYTREEWRKGNIPVVPFPFREAQVKVVSSRARDLLLLIVLEPKRGSGVKATDFFLELVPTGGRWLVSYWGPRGHLPPIPAGP